MVFDFVSNDEELIQHAWDEDIWFHVDKLSSAHLYLRLQPCKLTVPTPSATHNRKPAVQTKSKATNPSSSPDRPANHMYCTSWDDIPDALLQDIAQLTKANSIEGNKKDNVMIIYTPASNLLKTGDMATGAVSFHQRREVKRVHVKTRDNAIINRLNKTKNERFPDLAQEKQDHEKLERAKLRELERLQYAEQQRMIKERQAYKEAASYDHLMVASEMTTNKTLNEEDDDFFM